MAKGGAGFRRGISVRVGLSAAAMRRRPPPPVMMREKKRGLPSGMGGPDLKWVDLSGKRKV